MLKKDFARKKTMTFALFIFIMLSSLLASAGTSVMIQLLRSIDHLFVVSEAPHFVQMHQGAVEDLGPLDEFTAEHHRLIQDRQISEMLMIDNDRIFFGDARTGNGGSVMDNGFVMQNPSFDILLNLQNQRIEVARGEIAVPIYYMQREGLQLGDRIRIGGGSGGADMELVIADFVRDVQMNPSIISSKRFVVHAADYEALKARTGEIETLIEFRLHDPKKLNEFAAAYQSAGLPSKGPAVDISLFKMLNALTDGVVAAVILLVSFLLILISVLCLRFTILTSLQEDMKQIGVMKAIGLPPRDIRIVYLSKYIVLAVAACICGYLLSLWTGEYFASNITLYIGAAPGHILVWFIPALAAGIVLLTVLLFCALVLRRLHKMTAAETLRAGASFGDKGYARLPLHRSRMSGVNLFLGIKEVFGRPSSYLLLLFIFAACCFMVLVPAHFLNTVRSPGFVAMMGTGVSDLRIDLQPSEDLAAEFARIQDRLVRDPEVEKFASLMTARYGVVGSEGALENIYVETGDFSVFPLTYSSGRAPASDTEIALSSLNADSLEKGVGDRLTLVDGGGKELVFTVSGIYQDVTNGGKTAKALLSLRPDQLLRITIQADITAGTSIQAKMEQYAGLFPGAKVTDMNNYLSQTFGTTIRQIERATGLAVVIAACLSVLITSLYLNMLLAKESSRIAVMKSLGFMNAHIRAQYLTRMLIVLLAGIAIGTIGAGTLGEGLAGLLMSFMGASRIEFEIRPIVTYLACPLALGLLVTAAALASLRPLKKYNLANTAME